MKTQKTKESILFEIERFSKKNYFFLLMLLALTMWFFIYKVNTLEKLTIKNNEALHEKFNTVIAITDNGSIIEIESQSLLADDQQRIVSRVLRNLVLDRAEITSGFTRSKYTNTEIVNNSEKLKDFLQYILIDNKKKAERVFVNNPLTDKMVTANTLSQQAIGYFDAYVEAVKQMVQKNKLPHYTSILDTRIEKYKPKGKNFHIEIIYKVSLQFFNGFNEDKTIRYKTHIGEFQVTANGYFDIRTRRVYKRNSPFNGLNKLGLHFSDFKISIPTME